MNDWGVPLEEGVCSPKHSIDDMEVSTLEAGYHLSQKIRPLLREVFSSNDTDGIAQLKKYK